MRPYIKKTIETYDKHADRFAENRKGFVLDVFFDVFDDLLKGKNILEIGCGPGRDARLLTDRGYHVTGLDLSEKLVEIARSRVPEAAFLVADMLTLPFEDNSFDGIWSAATLHHLTIEDMKVAIKEMYRVLKNGGAAFVSTKAGDGMDIAKEEEFDGSERFFNYTDQETCAKLFVDAGFRIHSIETYTTNDLFPDMKTYVRAHQGYHDIFVIKD